jgi:hypothetical protein
VWFCADVTLTAGHVIGCRSIVLDTTHVHRSQSSLTDISGPPVCPAAHRTSPERQTASRCSPSGWRRPWVLRRLLQMCWALRAGVQLPARLRWLGQRVACRLPGS